MLAHVWLDCHLHSNFGCFARANFKTLLRMRRLPRSCCWACADFRGPAAAHAQTSEILLQLMHRLLQILLLSMRRLPAAARAQTSEILLLHMLKLQRSCCWACADFRDLAAAHARSLDILLLRMCTVYRSCCWTCAVDCADFRNLAGRISKLCTCVAAGFLKFADVQQQDLWSLRMLSSRILEVLLLRVHQRSSFCSCADLLTLLLLMRRLLLIFLLRMRRLKRSVCSSCALFKCFAAVPWGTSPRSGWQSGRSALWRWWQCTQPPERIRVPLDEHLSWLRTSMN